MSVPVSSNLSPNELRFRWETTVCGLEHVWSECLGDHNALSSFALQQAIENARLEGVEHHYLVGEDESGAACLLPCFAFRVSLATVSGPMLRAGVGLIRKVFPSFLMARIFVVGSAISNYGDLIGLKGLHEPGRWTRGKIADVFYEVRKRAESLGIGIILVKELEDEIKGVLEPALDGRFFFADSLPATFLSVEARERGGYFASIRSKYRNKIKKRKSIGKQKGLSWRVVPVQNGRGDEIYSLYLQVLNNSKVVFEKVNRAFFDTVAEAFPKDAFYIFGFMSRPEGEQLISCELVLCDGDAMRLVYSGFDYAVKRDSDLYFNVFYAAIEEAEKRGFRRMHLGQTAYEVKAELGAQRINLFVAACHTNPWIHPVMEFFKGVLLPTVNFPDRDVFSVPPPKPKSGDLNRIALPKV